MAAILEAAREWSAEHPRFVDAVTQLELRGLRVAVFSSTVREIVCRALDLPPGRKPCDIDLLVPRGDFGGAAGGLGAVVMHSQVAFRTGDGLTASMDAQEAIAHIGGDEIQFMDPLGPLRVGAARYQTEYTPAAAAARTIIETDEGLLPLAHLADTIGMYGILQREKGDLRNAAILLAAGDSLSGAYAAERAQDMGWDARAWGFVNQARLLAADGVSAPPELRIAG